MGARVLVWSNSTRVWRLVLHPNRRVLCVRIFPRGRNTALTKEEEDLGFFFWPTPVLVTPVLMMVVQTRTNGWLSLFWPAGVAAARAAGSCRPVVRGVHFR